MDDFLRWSLVFAVFAGATCAVARADCETGFEFRELPVRTPDATYTLIPYFVCVPGGAYGDPDLGWDMVHLLSIDGREIRAREEDAGALRLGNIAR